MNKLLTAVLMVTSFSGNTSSPQIVAAGDLNWTQAPLQCPVIKWKDYPKPSDYETPVKFEVVVEGTDVNKRLKYTWFASAGRIVSGQGTNAITVSMKGQDGQSVTATVIICGLPDECENTASATASSVVQ